MNNENAMQVVPQQNMVYADEGFNLEVDMTTAKTQYCSMRAETPEEQTQLFNAMNNPDKRLADCINKQIAVKDVYVEVVTCTNQETGEQTPAPRIVLIDEDGVSYQCVSIGIYSAIKKLIQVFGEPTWKTPVKVEVVQITKGTRKMLTLGAVA